jgi:hypothetical protein
MREPRAKVANPHESQEPRRDADVARGTLERAGFVPSCRLLLTAERATFRSATMASLPSMPRTVTEATPRADQREIPNRHCSMETP